MVQSPPAVGPRRFLRRTGLQVRRVVLGTVGAREVGVKEGEDRRAGSRRAHARTTVQEVHLERRGDLVIVEIQASGFLYGMVRLLMAQLTGRQRAWQMQRQRWRRQR